MKYVSTFSRQGNTTIGELYFDNKKGGHGQQLFRILLKVISNYRNMKPVRGLFYLFKISIDHILVRLGSASSLTSGFRTTSARLLAGLVLGGLGIHDLSQLV